MKKYIYMLIASVAVLAALTACNKEEWPEGADLSSLRIALTPDPGVVPAEGLADFQTVVVVARGPEVNVPWEASVDFTPDWVTVEKVTVTGQFTGTYAGDDREKSQPGIKINVQPNTGAKRTAVLRFTLADGGSITYTLNQSRSK